MNYEQFLLSLTPEFWWFRDWHSVTGDKLRVQATVFLNGGVSSDDLAVRINGAVTSITEIRKSDYADQQFWFAPESQRLGVIFETPVAALPVRFDASVYPKHDEKNSYQSGQFVNWNSMEPTPPIVNIERVSGKGATAYNYYNNGLSDYFRFSKLAAQSGVDLKSSETSILDWGCGCGRLTRHFIDYTPCRVAGIDIDSDNVGWCQSNLENGAFHTVDLFPPTSFADESFDLIFANSVLSHLQLDAAHAWLDEVARLLKPNGLALLSYHGDFSIAMVLGRAKDFAKRVYDEGFNSDKSAAELQGFISDPSYYRQTFMNDHRASEIFSSHLQCLGFRTGLVSRYQNIAILRRR